jgi:hypothetical protein
MSRKSNRLARFSGLALAGAGLAHPRMWEPMTKTAFPRNTRQHVYTNGGIETVLGWASAAGRPAAWPSLG